MNDSIGITFTRTEIDARLDQLDSEFSARGDIIACHRVNSARDDRNPYQLAEIKALLLGLPSPNPAAARMRSL